MYVLFVQMGIYVDYCKDPARVIFLRVNAKRSWCKWCNSATAAAAAAAVAAAARIGAGNPAPPPPGAPPGMQDSAINEYIRVPDKMVGLSKYRVIPDFIFQAFQLSAFCRCRKSIYTMCLALLIKSYFYLLSSIKNSLSYKEFTNFVQSMPMQKAQFTMPPWNWN